MYYSLIPQSVIDGHCIYRKGSLIRYTILFYLQMYWNKNIKETEKQEKLISKNQENISEK